MSPHQRRQTQFSATTVAATSCTDPGSSATQGAVSVDAVAQIHTLAEVTATTQLVFTGPVNPATIAIVFSRNGPVRIQVANRRRIIGYV